jgi:hypothetical protein
MRGKHDEDALKGWFIVLLFRWRDEDGLWLGGRS